MARVHKVVVTGREFLENLMVDQELVLEIVGVLEGSTSLPGLDSGPGWGGIDSQPCVGPRLLDRERQGAPALLQRVEGGR